MQHHYAKVGIGIESYVTSRNSECPDGLIKMKSPPPHFKWIAESDGSYSKAPITSEGLNEYKESKKESLRQSCKESIESMFQSDALGQSNTYDCRGVDQLNLNMIVNGGIGGEVYTHDGVEFVWEMHTHEQCVLLLQSMNAHVKTQRDKLYQKVSLVNACTTCDEIDAVNW